jgi:hypothetical protein
MWNKIINWTIIFLTYINLYGQNFTYSGYVYNADGTGAVNVPVKLYKRTTPVMNGFTSQTNYNGHSYYRSTTTTFWSNAKSACEAMNGHLATISNAAENSFLFNTWPSGWIGYYQDNTGAFYSEPLGGWRWTENYVTNGRVNNYDVSSYTSGPTLNDLTNVSNMSLTNTPVYTSTGGKYLTFNGINTYGITPSLTNYFGSSKVITLVAWVYPTGNGVIVSELGVSSPSSGWHVSVMEITNGNTLNVGFWNGTGITQLSTPITLNQWSMVAITYDGTTMRGYRNGVSFGSVNFLRFAPHIDGGGNQTFAIGLSDATNMGSGAYGSFRLGAFQVYNTALSLDEINRCYMSLSYRFGLNPYLSWNGGEPNNSGSEDYAQFVGGGLWNDLPNGVSLPYVLEFDYVVTYTPWSLFRTVYTNSLGYWSFNELTNPSVEWYIQMDAPTPVTTLSTTDMIEVSKLILGTTQTKSIHYNRYDVNNDGRINIADENYINLKRINFLPSWIGTGPSRFYTTAQYTTLNTNTTNLKLSIPGVPSITINSPVSGSNVNYYLIAPAYKTTVNY